MENNLQIRSNDEMLELVRAENPGQVITEVVHFSLNKHGFYTVYVKTETPVCGKVKKCKTILPYPLSEYNRLSLSKQCEWNRNSAF